MRRQNNLSQLKEKEKALKKQLVEHNLLYKKFKALVIRKLTELGKRIDEHSENFNKELENIRKELVRTEEYNN